MTRDTAEGLVEVACCLIATAVVWTIFEAFVHDVSFLTIFCGCLFWRLLDHYRSSRESR